MGWRTSTAYLDQPRPISTNLDRAPRSRTPTDHPPRPTTTASTVGADAGECHQDAQYPQTPMVRSSTPVSPVRTIALSRRADSSSPARTRHRSQTSPNRNFLRPHSQLRNRQSQYTRQLHAAGNRNSAHLEARRLYSSTEEREGAVEDAGSHLHCWWTCIGTS